MIWQHSFSFLRETGLFPRVFDASDNIRQPITERYDLVNCGTQLVGLPPADAAPLLNAIKQSGARYILIANPNNYLCKQPYAFRPPLWRILESENLTFDIWACDDLPLMDQKYLEQAANHNPTSSEELMQYDFFRKLCALPFVEKIEIYGSRSVGKSKPDSDLDLMLYCNPPPTREQWLHICDIIDRADLPLEIDCKWDDGTLNTIFDVPDYVKSCLRPVYIKNADAQ